MKYRLVCLVVGVVGSGSACGGESGTTPPADAGPMLSTEGPCCLPRIVGVPWQDRVVEAFGLYNVPANPTADTVYEAMRAASAGTSFTLTRTGSVPQLACAPPCQTTMRTTTLAGSITATWRDTPTADERARGIFATLDFRDVTTADLGLGSAPGRIHGTLGVATGRRIIIGPYGPVTLTVGSVTETFTAMDMTFANRCNTVTAQGTLAARTDTVSLTSRFDGVTWRRGLCYPQGGTIVNTSPGALKPWTGFNSNTGRHSASSGPRMFEATFPPYAMCPGPGEPVAPAADSGC